MSVATVTSKGQVTLPLSVRKSLGIEPGDQVDFVEVPGGCMLRPRSKSLMSLYGCFGMWDGPPVTIEQMNADIAEAAAEEAP